MTDLALLLLTLPLLAAPILAPQRTRGRAMARLVLAGFAVGAIRLATGVLSLGGLASFGAADSSNSLFLSITLGVLVGALGPWPFPLDRASWSTGVPLAVVPTLSLAGDLQWAPFALGAVLGALPLFAGIAIPGGGRDRDPDLTDAAPGWWLGITLLISVAEPLLLVVLLPVPWLLPGRVRGWPAPTLPRRFLPLVALLLLAVLAWLALTVAGSPWARLGSYAATQPLSIGAERLLAVLGLSALVSLVAPWPLMRLAPLLSPVPAVVVVGYRFAQTLAPQGVAAWLPAVAMFLVPSALIAGLLGYRRTTLGSLALLGGVTGGMFGLAGGAVLSVMAVFPSLQVERSADRVTFFGSPWRAALVAVGVALVVVALLEVEVVMATILAGGMASTLARVARGVRSTPATDHST